MAQAQELMSDQSEQKSSSPPLATKRIKDAKKVDISSTSPTKKQAERYWQGLGRRKSAVARVRLFTVGEKVVQINGKDLSAYFPTEELRMVANGALRKMKITDKFFVSAHISGGGIRGQAEALRLAVARALVEYNADFRSRLKRTGYLRRDPREVERKKFGLKKARRAPQWRKR